MLRHSVALLCLALFFPVARAQEAPLEPAAPAPSPGSAAASQDLLQEIHAFYAAYWKAWDERELTAVANALAAEFRGLQVVAPGGVVELDKRAAVAGVDQFFRAVQDREISWGRTLLTVIPRSPTEAVAALRSDFSLADGGGETELSLEVLRKFPDGRWRLVRRWSEKARH